MEEEWREEEEGERGEEVARGYKSALQSLHTVTKGTLIYPISTTLS